MRHLLALITLSALLAPLSACDLDEASNAEFRAVTIDDRWAIYTPTHFPEVNTCDDYWNDRCAELSPSQCTVAKNRYRCTEDAKAVEIRDTFGFYPSTHQWVVYGLALEEGIVVDTLGGACKGMKGVDTEECLVLAKHGGAIAEIIPDVFEAFPGGGVGTIVIQDDLMMIEPKPVEEGNLMWEAADALGWTMPTLEYAIPGKEYTTALDWPWIIEDDIMIRFSPNGDLSLSTGSTLLTRRVGDTNLDELETVPKELVMIEKLPEG